MVDPDLELRKGPGGGSGEGPPAIPLDPPLEVDKYREMRERELHNLSIKKLTRYLVSASTGGIHVDWCYWVSCTLSFIA